MRQSLKHETVFYGLSKYANVVVTLLTTSVLARILSPSEFGVVSVVTVFTAFFTILSDMGLGTAVIQNKTLTDHEIYDIFSFSVYAALFLGILFAALGVPIAWFYGDQIYIKICMLLSISVFFNAANIIPNAVLMKEKKFSLVGMRLIAVSVASGFAAIVMALSGGSFYSIVAQSIIQAILIFLWNYWHTRLKFRWRFEGKSIQKVRQYSTYQFCYSLINYFARNLDNLLIGKVMGSVNLAYYDKGYRLMMYPVQNLTYVINPIMHPILSDYQNDKAYIYRSYLKVVKLLSLLGVFISAYCFWSGEEIIMLFFGRQWTASVQLFQLLSLAVWPQLVSTSAGAIYQSTGNTRMMFKSGTVHFNTTIILIVVGVMYGHLETLALLVAISLYLRFFIDYYFLVVRVFSYSYVSFLKEFFADAVIMLALMIVISVFPEIRISGILIRLVFKGVILVAVYMAGIMLTGQFRILKDILKKLKK